MHQLTEKDLLIGRTLNSPFYLQIENYRRMAITGVDVCKAQIMASLANSGQVPMAEALSDCGQLKSKSNDPYKLEVLSQPRLSVGPLVDLMHDAQLGKVLTTRNDGSMPEQQMRYLWDVSAPPRLRLLYNDESRSDDQLVRDSLIAAGHSQIILSNLRKGIPTQGVIPKGGSLFLPRSVSLSNVNPETMLTTLQEFGDAADKIVNNEQIDIKDTLRLGVMCVAAVDLMTETETQLMSFAYDHN